MPGFPGSFGDILEIAQKVQGEFSRLQGELAKKEVQASAGGGMVTITVNGSMEIVSVTIDRMVINPDDSEMLQDLVKAAGNEALRKAKEMFKGELQKLTGGLPIPGL